MEVVNLSGRTITLIDVASGQKKIYERTESVATVRIVERCVSLADGFEVIKYEYEEVKGLPAPKDGVTYIVTFAVLSALKHSRPDVICPDTSPKNAFRDNTGRTIAVKKFRVL